MANAATDDGVLEKKTKELIALPLVFQRVAMVA